jgi:hypothetical protein
VIPPGAAGLGTDLTASVGWDGSGQPCVSVGAFAIDVHNVNAGFMEFVDAGGYQEPVVA